jgi:hypothetical protein
MSSSQLPHFVTAIRNKLSNCEESALHPYRNFKFLLSLQGFKSFSFTRFDDLTQSEMPWFEGLGLDALALRPLMLFKGYLKGIRRVTTDVLSPDWLDFNGTLQQGIAVFQRLLESEEWSDADGSYEPPVLPGDSKDAELHQDRRRDGPSLQLAPDMSQLCNGGDCDTCGVWVDVAAELGCAGKVTVWNHSHCFDVM